MGISSVPSRNLSSLLPGCTFPLWLVVVVMVSVCAGDTAIVCTHCVADKRTRSLCTRGQHLTTRMFPSLFSPVSDTSHVTRTAAPDMFAGLHLAYEVKKLMYAFLSHSLSSLPLFVFLISGSFSTTFFFLSFPFSMRYRLGVGKHLRSLSEHLLGLFVDHFVDAVCSLLRANKASGRSCIVCTFLASCLTNPPLAPPFLQAPPSALVISSAIANKAVNFTAKESLRREAKLVNGLDDLHVATFSCLNAWDVGSHN